MAEPLCEYFGICGGCTYQDLDYSEQLERKKKVLIKAIEFNDIKVFSGDEYYYRNRMDFIFTKTGIGFRRKGRWDRTFDLDKCVISNKRLNELITEVNRFFKNNDAFDLQKKKGTFRYAVIRATSIDSSISFVLNADSTKISEAIDKIKEFKTSANNVIVTYVKSNVDLSVSDDYFIIKGKDLLKEEFFGSTFVFPVQGFFQNNYLMTKKMHEYCNKLLKKYNTKEYSLLDLYGGVGTFGIINSSLFKKGIIVDSVKLAIECANENIKYLKNVEAIELDAKQLKKLELPSKLFVIIDPPRTGMNPKTIEHLKRIKPFVIIYISCNVEQLGKDLKKLDIYSIKSAALFDLFPQTPHSEAVVELNLKSI